GAGGGGGGGVGERSERGGGGGGGEDCGGRGVGGPGVGECKRDERQSTADARPDRQAQYRGTFGQQCSAGEPHVCGAPARSLSCGPYATHRPYRSVLMADRAIRR